MKIRGFILMMAALTALAIPSKAQETNTTIEDISYDWDDEVPLLSQVAKPGIADFALAFATAHKGHSLTDEIIKRLTVKGYTNDESEFTIDRKAGFLELNFISDGTVAASMCYWNLPDGRKRVAVQLFDAYDPYPLPLLRFYDYDAKSNIMKALDSMPVDKEVDMSLCSISLPRVGKDIEIYPFRLDTPAKYEYAGLDGFRYKGPEELISGPSLGCYTGGSKEIPLYDAPGGKVVSSLPPETYIIGVISPKDGWWQIQGRLIWTIESSYLISETDPLWIKADKIGLGTRNYGGETIELLAEPREGTKVTGKITEEVEVIPIDATEDFEWIKVRWGKVTGWMRAEMLCSNPVTNCC